MTPSANQTMTFPSCGKTPLGIYPIVDRSDQLKPLYESGITTAQLRIKDLEGDALEQEIRDAITLSHTHKARLFVNDYWRLAIRHGAYGIHLGQEDIQEADIQAIHEAGLRLGISTHTPQEIDIALQFTPSYVAMGPVFVPISKALTYPTLGTQRLKDWAQHVPYPIVAIGGITRENIEQVAQTRAVSGIAMISGVLEGDTVSVAKTQALIRTVAPYGL